MDTFFPLLVKLYHQVNSYALLIGVMQLFVLYLFWKAQKRPTFDWVDMVVSKDTNRVSLTKFLQLVGGLTGTWIMVYVTLHDKLTYDVFVIYLTYVGACEGYSKYIAAKYGDTIPTVGTDSTPIITTPAVTQQTSSEQLNTVVVPPGISN